MRYLSLPKIINRGSETAAGEVEVGGVGAVVDGVTVIEVIEAQRYAAFKSEDTVNIEGR